MRTRTIVVALSTIILAAAIVVTSIVVGKSKNLASSSQQTSINQDPPGTINGALNKDLIPDQTAYSVFLRFAAHQTQVNKQALRSYFKFNGFGDTDIDAMQIESEDFRQRIGVLDREVKQIKDKNWPSPNPSVMDKLNQLQQKKEAIVSEVISSLFVRLSPQGREQMNRLIKDRIKVRMKIFPAPPPPGGPGWTKKHH